MAEYIVVAASCGVPTGKEDPITRLPKVAKFRRGDTVDSDKFNTEVGRDKIERLLRQGALRDPKDVQRAQQRYQSAFDIPLDRDPGGEGPDEQVIKLPGDDIEDDDADDEEPLAPPMPSLVSGTPEARLAGDSVDPAETGGDAAPEPEQKEAGDDTEGSLPEPPSRGASTAVWQQYAERNGLGTDPDASRAEIQAAYDERVAKQS